MLANVSSMSLSNRHIYYLFSARDEFPIRWRDDRGTGNGLAGFEHGKSRLPLPRFYDEFSKLLCSLRTRASSEKQRRSNNVGQNYQFIFPVKVSKMGDLVIDVVFLVKDTFLLWGPTPEDLRIKCWGEGNYCSVVIFRSVLVRKKSVK